MTSNGTGTAAKRKGSRFMRMVRGILSYAIGGACLFWLFHDLPLDRLLHTLREIHWWRLGPSVVLTLAAYLCVAWEWQLLLRPVGLLPFGRAARAVFAGRFANDVLPMQIGYLVRLILASRWMGVGLAAALPSLIVERLWDGLWLALGIGLVSFFVPLPADVTHARDVLGATVLAGTLAVGAVILFRRRILPVPGPEATPNAGAFGRIRFLLGCLADGMHDIARSRLLPAVIGLALLKLVIQALAFLGLVWAFGFELPFEAAVAVFLAAYLGMCIPSTPASTGLFQVFVVACLGFFGVAKPAAAGFSLVSFATLTLPPAFAGFFALARSGLTLREIRRQAR